MAEDDENEKIFMRITNKDIYDEMKKFHEASMKQSEINQQQHTDIIKRLDITNGKVKLAKWVATTSLSIVLIVLGILVSHIGK